MKKDGPPGATANGYNENRALFATGKCGMWIDATVTAGYLYDPEGEPGRRQGRLRAGADHRREPEGARLVLVLGARHPGLHQAGRRGQEVRQMGDLEGLHQAGRRERGLGRGASRHPPVDLQQPRLPEGRALRRLRAEGDRDHRPGQARPSTRCPIRACSSPRSPSSRASAPRPARTSRRLSPGQDTGEQALAEGPGLRRAHHEAGRLPEVSQPPAAFRDDRRPRSLGAGSGRRSRWPAKTAATPSGPARASRRRRDSDWSASRPSQGGRHDDHPSPSRPRRPASRSDARRAAPSTRGRCSGPASASC